MSRRFRKPLPKKSTLERGRPKMAGPTKGGRPLPVKRMPAFAPPRRDAEEERALAATASRAAEAAQLPTKVQTVTVTADEANMRVDRFLEARFPGLSFSHIQRIVRKGELRINGRRADSKDRLEEGQNVRIPPLRRPASSG